jgi:hypothetical protein
VFAWVTEVGDVRGPRLDWCALRARACGSVSMRAETVFSVSGKPGRMPFAGDKRRAERPGGAGGEDGGTREAGGAVGCYPWSCD